MKFTYRMISKIDLLSPPEQQDIARFLHTHLDEFGDKLDDIMKAIDYAIGDHPTKGGFILTASEGEKYVGAVVVNKTGMSGYIPENILVYIAVHKDYRGKGLGGQLMRRAIETASGDIALHVEHDNPARHLYEKIGFTNKYLEMRYSKKA